MKKFLKLFILCIILLFVINIIKNIYIINHIIEISNNYLSDITSYKGKIESHSSYISKENNTENISSIVNTEEFFYKDNIYLLKKYKNSQFESLSWKNNNTNESMHTTTETVDIVEKFIYTDIMKIDFIIKEDFLNNKIKLYIFNFIKSDDQNYIIKGKEAQFYYSKKTGLLTKFYVDESRYEIYSIEKNNVIDEELQKPTDIQ